MLFIPLLFSMLRHYRFWDFLFYHYSRFNLEGGRDVIRRHKVQFFHPPKDRSLIFSMLSSDPLQHIASFLSERDKKNFAKVIPRKNCEFIYQYTTTYKVMNIIMGGEQALCFHLDTCCNKSLEGKCIKSPCTEDCCCDLSCYSWSCCIPYFAIRCATTIPLKMISSIFIRVGCCPCFTTAMAVDLINCRNPYCISRGSDPCYGRIIAKNRQSEGGVSINYNKGDILPPPRQLMLDNDVSYYTFYTSPRLSVSSDSDEIDTLNERAAFADFL